MQEGRSGDFSAGDTLLLVDEKDRQFLVTFPEEGRSLKVKGEEIPPERLAELHDGELLNTKSKRRFLVFRPTQLEITMNMPRQAQIIYPKDQASILVWADIAPGQRVVEVGVGHGALTMTLLRALGPEGRLTSYDNREDHLNRTRKNAAQYLGEEVLQRWEPVLADPSEEGFGGRKADRVITDIPEPWAMLPQIAEVLENGGVWAAWLPTVMQMANLMNAIKTCREFCLPVTFETLQRFWHVQLPSIRPAHEMKAHTGFLVVCRRRWQPPLEASETVPLPGAENGLAGEKTPTGAGQPAEAPAETGLPDDGAEE